jgi:hypothetical protein
MSAQTPWSLSERMSSMPTKRHANIVVTFYPRVKNSNSSAYHYRRHHHPHPCYYHLRHRPVIILIIFLLSSLSSQLPLLYNIQERDSFDCRLPIFPTQLLAIFYIPVQMPLENFVSQLWEQGNKIFTVAYLRSFFYATWLNWCRRLYCDFVWSLKWSLLGTCTLAKLFYLFTKLFTVWKKKPVHYLLCMHPFSSDLFPHPVFIPCSSF